MNTGSDVVTTAQPIRDVMTTAQPIRDENYPHLLSKQIKDEAD